MVKKSKAKSFKAETEEDVVYDEAEDPEDEKEWVEDKKPEPAVATEPERYDTPEKLAEAAKVKEKLEKESEPAAPNSDLSINMPATPAEEK